MKPDSPRLLDQLAATIRVRNYSYRTEQAYRMWAKQYIRFHNLQHPRDMRSIHVKQFLDHLALDRNVAPNTQNQALNALNFLYREVLDQPLGEITGVQRAKNNKSCQSC